jgi:hypothetical protein
MFFICREFSIRFACIHLIRVNSINAKYRTQAWSMFSADFYIPNLRSSTFLSISQIALQYYCEHSFSGMR